MHSSIRFLKTCLLPFLFSVICVCDAEDHPPSPQLVAAIDKLVERNGVHADEPGVAILIRQPGKLTFHKGYGLANLKTKAPITPRTMFELASVSKTFTATATLILHDRGKLSIDDEVRKHIPELPEAQKNRPVHIRDLLHHTSGLPEYFDFEDVPRRNKTFWVNEDYLQYMAQRKWQLSVEAPGDKYEYCNTNFMLLAVIVSRVSKKPFHVFMHDEIFGPVGMEHTFIYETPQSVPEKVPDGCNRAIAYEWRKRKEIWDPTWGAPPARQEELLVIGDGGVWTNLEDMAKWDQSVRDQKLLKHETWKRALTPSKTRDGKVFSYGLGWDTYYDKPEEIYGYGHDGSWGGFNTSYYRYLTHDRTTVLLSNRGNIDTDKLWTGLDKVVENHVSRKQ